MKYHIWSFEHNAWWRAARRGYTINLTEAGIYEEAEALEICKGANLLPGQINEAMVPIF